MITANSVIGASRQSVSPPIGEPRSARKLESNPKVRHIASVSTIAATKEGTNLKHLAATALISTMLVSYAGAETRTYGSIDLTGLARASWDLNPLGESNAMVCNVNGPDGFLTIRARPNSNSKANRRLKRLAIVVVDTRERAGKWVKVVTANRTHSPNGRPQQFKNLHVTGWAHSNYLCDFLD